MLIAIERCIATFRNIFGTTLVRQWVMVLSGQRLVIMLNVYGEGLDPFSFRLGLRVDSASVVVNSPDATSSCTPEESDERASFPELQTLTEILVLLQTTS